MENNMEVFQKLKKYKYHTTQQFHSGYLHKENKNTNLKIYVHPYVHCSIIYNSQDMEVT